jgi:hypothetical protein
MSTKAMPLRSGKPDVIKSDVVVDQVLPKLKELARIGDEIVRYMDGLIEARDWFSDDGPTPEQLREAGFRVAMSERRFQAQSARFLAAIDALNQQAYDNYGEDDEALSEQFVGYLIKQLVGSCANPPHSPVMYARGFVGRIMAAEVTVGHHSHEPPSPIALLAAFEHVTDTHERQSPPPYSTVLKALAELQPAWSNRTFSAREISGWVDDLNICLGGQNHG